MEQMKEFKRKVRNALFFGAALVAVLVFVGGCGSKGSNQGTAVAPYAVGPAPVYPINPSNPLGCGNCLVSPEFLASAYGEAPNAAGGSRFALDLDFWGDRSTGYNFTDPKLIVYYAGPIGARGKLNVMVLDPLCPIPIGTYDVYTTSSGNIVNSGQSYNATISNLKVNALVGTMKVEILLNLNVIYNPSYWGTSSQEINRFGGNVVILSINGQACQDGSYNLY